MQHSFGGAERAVDSPNSASRLVKESRPVWEFRQRRGPQEAAEVDGLWDLDSTDARGTAAHGLGEAAPPPRVQATQADIRSTLDQLAHEIAERSPECASSGRCEFRMRLNPPDLGTVQVHLTATENSVTATLVVGDESAGQLLESQVQALRESLARVGVSLERFDVAHGGGGARDQWQRRDADAETEGTVPAWSRRRIRPISARAPGPNVSRIDLVA